MLLRKNRDVRMEERQGLTRYPRPSPTQLPSCPNFKFFLQFLSSQQSAPISVSIWCSSVCSKFQAPWQYLIGADLFCFCFFLFFPLFHIVIGLKKTDTCLVHPLHLTFSLSTLSPRLVPPSTSYQFLHIYLILLPLQSDEPGPILLYRGYKLPWNSTWVLGFTYESSHDPVNSLFFYLQGKPQLRSMGSTKVDPSGLSLLCSFRVLWTGRGSRLLGTFPPPFLTLKKHLFSQRKIRDSPTEALGNQALPCHHGNSSLCEIFLKIEWWCPGVIIKIF